MEVKGPPAASAAPALALPGSPADLVRALFPTASGTTDLLAELSSADGGAYFLAFHKFHLMEPIPAGTTAIELMDWYDGRVPVRTSPPRPISHRKEISMIVTFNFCHEALSPFYIVQSL